MSLLALWNRFMPAVAQAGEGGNPILDWLDAAGLPWRSTRAELAARYGVSAANPYQWDIVPLDVQPPPLAGMLWPFGFQAFPLHAPAMPPVSLSTHIHVGDEAEANIRTAASQFGRALGARRIVSRHNTRMAEWQFGGAAVRLLAWPPALQSGAANNPAHGRDPRLVTACSVTVQTGWRPPLSAQDLAWLDGFVAIGPTISRTPSQPRAGLADLGCGDGEANLEFSRAAPATIADFRGRFGLSGDGRALIVCNRALYVVPLTLVTGFDVARTLPARGRGGSSLTARCATDYAACPAKDLQVARGERADDLNERAAALAAATGKPFTIGEYTYDE